MRILETRNAPNCRRVRIFLCEKELNDVVEYLEIDIKNGENLTQEFRSKNPMMKVPVLELPTGICISETTAIFQYFEEQYPDTVKLLGGNPLEKSIIEQWVRWLDFYFFFPAGMSFQHTTGYFRDRMNPIAAWGHQCGKAVEAFMVFLNEHLKNRNFICLDHFTVADIVAVTTIDFAKRRLGLAIKSEHNFLELWHRKVSVRPSVLEY